MSILNPRPAKLNCRPELEEALDAFLSQLANLAAERGLAGAVDRLPEEGSYGHGNYGSVPVVLIPGNAAPGAYPPPCAPVVVAVISKPGNDPRHGAKAVMAALRAHLIRCPGVELVCIVSVAWGPKVPLDGSRQDLRTHVEANSLHDVVGVLAVNSRLTRLQVETRELLEG
jgi:hypothetical protein